MYMLKLVVAILRVVIQFDAQLGEK